MSDEQPDTTARGTASTRSAAEAPEPGGTVTAIGVRNDGIPPAGDDIHLPGGTPIPLLIALGITLMLVGTTISWLWTIIGGLIFIPCLVLWIRDTRAEVAHLPDEHGAPSHH